MRQRNQSTVDASTNTGITNSSVHRVGKINWARPERQRDHATFRSKNKYLVLIKIGFQTLHELRRISDIALPVDNPIQPINIWYFVVIFIGPVSGYSPLGSLVHFARANLNFEWFATGTDNSGVQTLIQVKFRHCNVVLETPNNRLPSSVDTSQSCVTIFH